MPRVDEPAYCGKFEVFENRAAHAGRKIDLNVIVLPSRTAAKPDAITFLAGGGVVPATRYALFLSRAFAGARQDRDILLVDQRGTWGSNPLSCEKASEHPAPPSDMSLYRDYVKQCRSEVQSGADLRFYTTPLAMDDLDDVRAWLGYKQVDILGVSYGTEAAQVYLRQHPEHVRVAALRGVLPVGVPFQVDFAKHAQATLDKVLRTCEQQTECHNSFPNLDRELDELLRRASDAPLVLKSGDGTGNNHSLSDRALRGFINESLADANQAAGLPLLVHLAFQGQFDLLSAVIPPPTVPTRRPMPFGIFMSLICTEAVPQISLEHEQQSSKGTFLGDFPVRQQVQACEDWPRGDLPKGFWEPVRSEVPTLLLSGDLDPVTPPENAAIVAKTLSNSRSVLLPNRSHSDIDPCVNAIELEFLVSGDLKSLDTSCLVRSRGLNFPTNPESFMDALRRQQ